MGAQKEIRRETTVKETTIETFAENNHVDNRQDEVQKLLDECQGYQYSQSSKFSTLARSIVLGVIGTIWVISYTHNGFVLATNWLLASLISSFVYLAMDIIHYFSDTCFYRNEYFRFEKERKSNDAITNHDNRMNDRSRKSFCAIVVKFSLLIIVCTLFIIGFCLQMI